jgi:hypothetical protein
LNQLRIKAPYGYYVIRYNVVPRSLGTQRERKPFTTAGAGMGNHPMGLFGDDDTASTNFYPDSGTIDDIPVETHVRISSNLSPASTAVIPEDERILSRCGLYIFVTKDRDVSKSLVSTVENWTIDAEQTDEREPE